MINYGETYSTIGSDLHTYPASDQVTTPGMTLIYSVWPGARKLAGAVQPSGVQRAALGYAALGLRSTSQEGSTVSARRDAEYTGYVSARLSSLHRLALVLCQD
jgi:hypothetical protein